MKNGDWRDRQTMRFVAPARKDGEFKTGDIVAFADMEWAVGSGEPANILGVYHLALVSGGESWVWARRDDLKLKVPVEMRG